jgi:hypothetical protein
MLLSEQERLLANEVNLINNPNTYALPGTLNLIYSYGTPTMPADGIIFLNLTFTNVAGTSQIIVYIRYMPILTVVLTSMGSVNPGVAVWLPQGSQNIEVYGVTTGTATISNMQVGYTLFNDCAGFGLSANSTGSVTVNSRVTPVGPLNQVMYAITACSYIGSGTTSIQSVSVDGVSQSFDESNGSGTQAHSVKCFVPCSVGSSHTVIVTQSNSSATIYLTIIATPWICTSSSRFHQPVTLKFPQESTLYAVIGILFADTVKSCYVGKQKAVSFGAADYYGYSSAGTGKILSFNYSFDSVNVAQVLLSMGGLGCCIESIAVDVM